MNISPDFNLVINEALILSIQSRHGFISYQHLFVAILSVDCEARAYCKEFKVEKWKSWLQNYFPATGTETMEDSLPLTLFTEHVIKNANDFVAANGDKAINSIHLLLALFCMKCEVTDAACKTGLIFEDVAEQYGRKPLKRTYPIIPVSQLGAYPGWKKFFMSGQSKKKNVEQLCDRAYELSLYEQYDICLLVCEAALSLEPDNFDCKYLQVLSCMYKRDFQAALTYAKGLTGEYANSADFQLTVSYLYDELGQYDEAATILDNILAKDPDQTTFLNNRGFNLSRQARYAEAVPYYEKAISVDPKFAYSWNNLGFAKYKLGKIDEALECINKSLEFDRGNSYAYKNKGIIYLEQNDKENASLNFQLALRYGYTKRYGNEVLALMKSIN